MAIRGNYDASLGLFPPNNIGSGLNGTIAAGDLWYISVAGTLGGTNCEVGASIRALINNASSASDWSINHPQKARLLLRSDTTAKWTSENPILGKGEAAITLDSNAPALLKIGDGSTAWAGLHYLFEPTAATHTFNSYTTDHALLAADVCTPSNGLPIILMNTATANSLTIPANADVAIAVGSIVKLIQIGVGQTTLVPDSGVTLHGTPGLNCRDQYSAVELVKYATDSWYVTGDLAA